MYSYEYDVQTGGILLNTSPIAFSKEPRPVYYKELDLLGFDKYWDYDKQDDLPYMWAEANKYYYFGRLVAQVKGGDLFTVPEICIKEEPYPTNNGRLIAVDIAKMIEKNYEFLTTLQQETVRKIENVWKRYNDKLDVFYVAFSGGKDSIVLLDLVKKALPKDAFVVVFGDTQMEFPDTYAVVNIVEAQCKLEGINFYRAKSDLDVYDSWRDFAPPSRTLRWCCSVHKSTPQVLKLREVLGVNDFNSLAFVGVRGYESARRSEYEFESLGAKQKGQRSANPILDWTSAEIWLHIYKTQLQINKAYKKGSQRVGCLCCPMSASKADYFQHRNYAAEMDSFADVIISSNIRESIKPVDYISNGGWNARKDGNYSKNNNSLRYKEQLIKDELIIEVREPSSDWHEWIKTLGEVQKENDEYVLCAEEMTIHFKVIEIGNGYDVHFPSRIVKSAPTFAKLFKQVFHKSLSCLSCKTCEVLCSHNCISFEDTLKITDCIKCRECHELPMGCLAYYSLRTPQGEGKKMKSINSFATHPPKTEWIADFFDRQSDFLAENSLGPVQKPFFKRFLKDAGLIDTKNNITELTFALDRIGWDISTSLGIILANVAYNPQFGWYIEHMAIGNSYLRKELEDMMLSEGNTENTVKSVVSAYKRIVSTPFGSTLNFGYVDDQNYFSRTKCHIDSPLVILYSLYKYAENCGDYYEFTVSRLFNENIESDGISPARIFGIERDDLETILRGLAAKYPEFLNATFTHDLETISLNNQRTSADVIGLLEA